MSAIHLGFYNAGGTRTRVRFQFTTHASAGANVAPSSTFEAADIRLYRAADSGSTSATQRSSANGITMTSPFDSLTGVHDVIIDLSDNTDAGFYATGYQYTVMLTPDETIDSQAITGVVLAYFEIGLQPVSAVVATNGITRASFAPDTGLQSIRSATAQAGAATSITLDASASASDDYYNDRTIFLTGGTGAGQYNVITDYVGSTKVATVEDTWITNPDSATTFAIFPAGTSAAEMATAVWAAATRTLSAGAITTATFAAGAIDAAAIATDAIDADALAANAVDEILDEQIGDGTITMRQSLRVLGAVLAGKLSGAATTTITIRNLADSANVVVATVDSSGNRSAVTVTP